MHYDRFLFHNTDPQIVQHTPGTGTDQRLAVRGRVSFLVLSFAPPDLDQMKCEIPEVNITTDFEYFS